LEIVECKFARNGLTNRRTFLTNILKNIIWHLFAGESHQVVKFTVPYYTIVDVFLSSLKGLLLCIKFEDNGLQCLGSKKGEVSFDVECPPWGRRCSGSIVTWAEVNLSNIGAS
jgi:hypothetical protein